MSRHPHWSLGLVLACAVAACSSPSSPPSTAKSSAPVAKASSAPASGAPSISTDASASTLPLVSSKDVAPLTGSVSVPFALTEAGGGGIVASGGGNIVASGGGNIVAQGAGNIVAQGAGNIVAQGAGNLISPNGGTYALTAASDEVPLANTEVALALGNGELLKRNGQVLVVRTGPQGNFRIRNLPVGVTYQVVVFARTKQGPPARLKALARSAAAGAVADVDVASTLVATDALQGKSKLGDLDLEALKTAVEATRKAVAADPTVDLTSDAKVTDRMKKVKDADATVAKAMTDVGQKLDQNAVDPATVASNLDQTTDDEPAVAGLCTLPMEAAVLLADETAKPASFDWASGVAVDGTGMVYVADRFADKVLKFQAAGGKPEAIGDDVGAGAVAAAKTAVFVGAPRENTINRYLAGAALALLKQGTPFGAAVAGAVDPVALAAVDENTLYVADGNKGRIFKVTIDGSNVTAALVDGAGNLKGPGGLAVDAAGNLYVADGYAHCIRKVTPDGKRSLFAGTEGQPGEPGAASEAADKAHFSQPRGLAMGADGTLYVADAGNQAIRAVKDGKVTTLAALQCGAGDPERLSDLGGLALSPDGKWLFVANGKHVVRFTVGATASPAPSASPSPSPSPSASADATASGTP